MAELKFVAGVDLNNLKRQLSDFLNKPLNMNLKGKFDDMFSGMVSDITGKKGGGTGAGGAFGMGKLLGRGSLILGALTVIGGALNKALGFLAESSAALKADMLLGKQVFSLFFKPFGDLISSLLRPVLMWLLKIAIQWNNLFGRSPTDRQFENPFISPGQPGGPSPEGPSLSDVLKEQWSAVLTDLEGFSVDFGDVWSKITDGFSKVFTDIIPAKFMDFIGVIRKWFVEDIPKFFGELLQRMKEFFTIDIPTIFEMFIDKIIELVNKLPFINLRRSGYTGGMSTEGGDVFVPRSEAITPIGPQMSTEPNFQPMQGGPPITINISGNSFMDSDGAEKLMSVMRDEMQSSIRRKTYYGI